MRLILIFLLSYVLVFGCLHGLVRLIHPALPW